MKGYENEIIDTYIETDKTFIYKKYVILFDICNQFSDMLNNTGFHVWLLYKQDESQYSRKYG